MLSDEIYPQRPRVTDLQGTAAPAKSIQRSSPSFTRQGPLIRSQYRPREKTKTYLRLVEVPELHLELHMELLSGGLPGAAVAIIRRFRLTWIGSSRPSIPVALGTCGGDTAGASTGQWRTPRSSAATSSGPTLRVEDTRLDLLHELADVVSSTVALIERSSEQCRELPRRHIPAKQATPGQPSSTQQRSRLEDSWRSGGTCS